ncbi:flavin-containing monooxygenase [Alteromonas oceanisediminis]|uniref:flavin-containing monooxygenase n=1 Tax=Alteromonas oceanisediminis TaxID=2836180 RepID=UPI001BDAED31|nr:NAD(P)/FAD-dependent oxidoreductase [Alteromonas oceanisediminis]MBT0586309.1 NAD(P)/FAD-dependent oxidoreductase [Alteromonas oceanisediminis]
MSKVNRFTAVIIGSGFGGQCAAIELARMGIDDFIILERRAFVGGTWAQNTYPGAAVDVQSPLYSLSFEPYDWSRMFAQRDELSRYTESIYSKYRLHQKTRVNQNVKRVEWQETAKQWLIQTDAGDEFNAQFVINASGPLSTPIIPKFQDQATFQGATFHTNNWDHSIDLSGKNVAIIGSGASAAQVIPAIAEHVKALHVFQRTPHWVLPRWDIVFSPWQRRLLKNRFAYSLVRRLIYWLLEVRILGFKYSKTLLKLLAARPAKKHLRRQVPDPELRAKLTPDFTIGCKRIIVSSSLYPALGRSNVVLHDKYDSISTFTESGVTTAQGHAVPLDVIIYSTGYDASDGIISYPVIGKSGRLLSDVWSDFPRAYLGTSVPKFPNFFVVTGPNTGIGHTSALFVIEAQMAYIRQSIQAALSSGASAIEATSEAENEYTEHIHQEMTKTVWHYGGCQSWYKSKSGKVTAMFPGFSFTYRRLCRKFKPQHHVFTE